MKESMKKLWNVFLWNPLQAVFFWIVLISFGLALLVLFSSCIGDDKKMLYVYLEDSYQMENSTYLNRDWRDVNKEFDGNDEWLCWAASASNVLAYAGYGGGDEEFIFNYFKSTFSNGRNYVRVAIEHWLEVHEEMSLQEAKLQISEYVNPTNYRAEIIFCFEQENGIVIDINDGEGFHHSLTVWGYFYDEGSDTFSIYFTDSNDQSNYLHLKELYRSGDTWYFLNYHGSDKYYIDRILLLHKPGNQN